MDMNGNDATGKVAWTPRPWSKPEYHNDVGPDDNYFIQWIQTGPAKVEFDGRAGAEQAMVNAYLISAAPDLYEALMYAQALLASEDMGHDDIDNALAKARGEVR